MYELNNLLNNPNIVVTEQVGPIRILEHQTVPVTTPEMAKMAFYAEHTNLKKRQALIELKDSGFTVSAGAMQWMLGNVELTSGVKGVGDLVGKLFTGAVTKESAIKPEYCGTGFLMLEPTYNFLFVLNLAEWGDICVDDGMFLGCENTVKTTPIRASLKAAALGGDGLFHLGIVGNGYVLLESPVPYSHLTEVVLRDDVLTIDGNMAVAWSSSLKVTLEKAARGLLASSASGEGLVKVYRGSGRVLIAT